MHRKIKREKERKESNVSRENLVNFERITNLMVDQLSMLNSFKCSHPSYAEKEKKEK
jgi:hypothetical protein